MADLLKLIPKSDWKVFTDNFAYPTNFMGQKLFPAIKTDDLDVSIAQLTAGGNVPVMAQIHAFDSEARIGERPSFEVNDYTKLLIKEKLNQTERITQFLKYAPDNKVKQFVFDDAANLISRVLTRAEVATMEVLGKGQATYNENNVALNVSYGITPTETTTAWSSADADILGDIEAIIDNRAKNGYATERAITSSTVISYMLKNTAIKAFWANKTEPLTKSRLISWIYDNYGVEIVVNDATYKTSISSSAKRFYPENAITFLATRTAVGQGMFGYTPEELALPETSEKNFVTVTQWFTEDPVAVWTKASALYVPVLKDSNSVSIYNIKA